MPSRTGRAPHDDRFPGRTFRTTFGRTRLSQTGLVCRSDTGRFSVRRPTSSPRLRRDFPAGSVSGQTRSRCPLGRSPFRLPTVLVWLSTGLRSRGRVGDGVAQERLCLSSGVEREPFAGEGLAPRRRGLLAQHPLERLGVPSLLMSDGPHGLRTPQEGGDHLGLTGIEPATCFPPASGVASSRDPDLVRRVGEALGREARALGVSVFLGPGINMKRSPLRVGATSSTSPRTRTSPGSSPPPSSTGSNRKGSAGKWVRRLRRRGMTWSDLARHRQPRMPGCGSGPNSSWDRECDSHAAVARVVDEPRSATMSRHISR